jgi:hypothetical protein
MCQVARHVSRETVECVELFNGTSAAFLDSLCTILLTEVIYLFAILSSVD